MTKEDYIKEYERTCNQCRKVWHSLASREKEISKKATSASAVQAMTACGGNLGAATQSQRNAQSLQEQLDKLKKCPKCGSSDYEEKIITYPKK